jgi:hypothetical protein
LTAGGYAAVTFIYIFAVGFCFSYAGLPWIICSEIFGLRMRGIGMAVCTATHWLFNFVIARSVPYMVSNIGLAQFPWISAIKLADTFLDRYGTYFVFASFITLSIPFVYFCVPETKGLSLEEIETLFGEESAAESDAVLEEAKSAGSMHIEHSDV